MKNSKYLLIALPLIACFSVLAAFPSDVLTGDARVALAKAMNYSRKGDWALTLRLLTEAQQASPRAPVILDNLGIANANLDRPVPAIAWFAACTQSDSQYAANHDTLDRIASLKLSTEAKIHTILQKSESLAQMTSGNSRASSLRIAAQRVAGAGFIDDALTLCPSNKPADTALCWLSFARHAAQVGDVDALKRSAAQLGGITDPQLSLDLTAYLYSMGLYEDAANFASAQPSTAEPKQAGDTDSYGPSLCLKAYENSAASLDGINPLLDKLRHSKAENADSLTERFATWQARFYDDDDSPLARALASGNFDQALHIANSLVLPQAKLRMLQRICNGALSKNDTQLARTLSMELAKSAASSKFSKEQRESAFADIQLAKLTAFAVQGQTEKAQSTVLHAATELQPILSRQLAFVSTVFGATATPDSGDSDSTLLGKIEGLLAQNQVAAASQLCANVQDKAFRQDAYSLVAAAQIRNAMLAEADSALQNNELTEKGTEHALLLATLAQGYAAAHRLPDVARVSGEALTECSGEPLAIRLPIMDRIWQAQVAVGDRYGAEQTRRSEFLDILNMQAIDLSKKRICTDLQGTIESYLPEIATSKPVAYQESTLNPGDVSAIIGCAALNLSDEYDKLLLIENCYKANVPAAAVLQRLAGPAFVTARLILPELPAAAGPVHDPHLWPLPGIPKQFSLRGYSTNYHWGFLHGGVGKATWLHDNIFQLRWSNRLRSTQASITVEGCNFYMRETGYTMWGPVENVYTGTVAGPRITGTYFGHDAFTSWEGPFEGWW